MLDVAGQGQLALMIRDGHGVHFHPFCILTKYYETDDDLQFVSIEIVLVMKHHNLRQLRTTGTTGARVVSGWLQHMSGCCTIHPFASPPSNN